MKISFVLPIYNEEGNIPELYERIMAVVKKLEAEYELIFINDFSRDGSLDLLRWIAKADKCAKIIDFSRNFGHQIAITAGIDMSEGDVSVIMDTDLQDQPEVVVDMIAKWREGFDVVYGKRRARKDTFFKKVTAKAFYRILRKLSTIDIPLDTGDFRLMDRKVVLEMRRLREHSRFMRGLTSWVGFRQTYVEFDREARRYGQTNYPLSKMVKFAFDGITAFSYKPLKIATYFGFFISTLAVLYSIYVVLLKIYRPEIVVEGWATVIIAVMMLGGVQLMILGIIGEYIGRIYTETQNRPLYVINKIYNG